MANTDISDLQFLVLGHLRGGDRSGKELRARLEVDGRRQDSPSFYQMMARLERNGFVTGRYVQKDVNERKVRERRYTIEGEGQRAFMAKLRFQVEQAARHRGVLDETGSESTPKGGLAGA